MAKIKLLLFTGGEIHDYKGCGEAIYDALKQTGHFDITQVEEDLSALEAPKLDPYDVVVFYYTVGTITDAQKNGLLSKGFVGIHSAADSFRDCPEYRAMIGGWFVTHPHYRQYQVSVVDPEHPITKGLEEFFVTDEQYILDYDPRVKVLCSALWKLCLWPGPKAGAKGECSISPWDMTLRPVAMIISVCFWSGEPFGQQHRIR